MGVFSRVLQYIVGGGRRDGRGVLLGLYLGLGCKRVRDMSVGGGRGKFVLVAGLYK